MVVTKGKGYSNGSYQREKVMVNGSLPMGKALKVVAYRLERL